MWYFLVSAKPQCKLFSVFYFKGLSFYILLFPLTLFPLLYPGPSLNQSTGLILNSRFIPHFPFYIQHSSLLPSILKANGLWHTVQSIFPHTSRHPWLQKRYLLHNQPLPHRDTIFLPQDAQNFLYPLGS
ncbi:hypothetical protein BC751_3093 [Cecembia calidifontis]|uniref:Uncharacterized protein n=1 Tax=Cecembia calidifontis TaxID=1187080 RepID=A0A4Q7PB23_9BACT|nr:hypothetical protein BC751_3093 [Cecembia calidifontis]